MASRPPLHPGLRLVLDLGPLIAFFAANARYGIFVATATFMAAVVLALVVSYALTRRLPVMPLVTALIVLVFGSLTLVLQDELFIKLKPTIIYLLFAGVLLGGLLFDKPLLGMVFDSVFSLTDEGWRKLTIRWALFFLFLALLNEIVWRTQTTDVWVAFKVFGVVPLTFVFAALQYPLLTKYAAPEPAPQQGPSSSR
jgi:intracellular septation protein